MTKLREIFILCRPLQWVKNILVFLGLFFSGSFLEINNIKASFLAFLIFVLTSSSVYILNDIIDKDKDKLHPDKRNRPIASGSVSVSTALIFFVIFITFAILLSFLLNITFLIMVVSYLIISIAYSIFLKKVFLLDVFLISSGYLIRVLAGVYAINRLPTIWFLMSVLFATLFIGFSKRRGELTNLGEDAQIHRENLKIYNIQFLDIMIFINATLALAAYLLFVIISSKLHKLMVITVPFILFAVYRYIYLVFNTKKADRPELLILDKTLLINNLIWLILFILTKFDYLGKYSLFEID